MNESTTPENRTVLAGRDSSALLGIDVGDNPDFSVEMNAAGEITRYQQIRIVSPKRARKLRKRGEHVFWHEPYGALCWRMWRDAEQPR